MHLKKNLYINERSHGDSPQRQVSEAGISWDGKTSAVVGESQQLFVNSYRQIKKTSSQTVWQLDMETAPNVPKRPLSRLWKQHETSPAQSTSLHHSLREEGQANPQGLSTHLRRYLLCSSHEAGTFRAMLFLLLTYTYVFILQIDIFIWIHDLFYQHFITCVIILHSVQYYKTANAPSLLLFFLAMLVQNF